ncbi:unnamed protein product [Arabidopsis thaliana]|jgi:hypothetical protein|uniref:ATP-dependent Clp protease ATP-binding subunit n=3 Tax=Arabidopsis thaliana TaxID=3702 RepID=Q9FIS4_ARATH|nr:ATP-dependent Clp protease ATP-binding subunit [Arabidopsis thaliana]ABN04732.1 At5g62140 [Arabidopsis thaliana]AED97569.1 ATP-dependent Clp protease ATP-binding subunit [Arabidopsis thaliana]BAB10176.1 unnamed protein product [Arabidopsis thaliana]VYS71143.1 unnamed protein product [Arabidopsis thaliana]|eukprot:NP_201020.1 ATP-dependent Clp protease ATP-binding subunit [Arabidopsis thaliana]
MASTKINSLTTTIYNYKSPRRYINHKSQNQIKLISNSLNPKPNTTQLPNTLYSVSFKTIGTGKLGISRYPDFEYSPLGGSGAGTAKKIDDKNRASNSELSVCFNVATLYIPSLTSQTTKFLGFPLPPFLKIDISPEIFQGTINQESGKVELEFMAKFFFTAGGGIYRAPALVVRTVLTTEESIGENKRGKGERLDEEGKCRLVGVAKVETIDDLFMNTFLSLPAECLADLQAIISVSDNQS